MLCVGVTDRDRERLGQRIADRRRELGLSISAAARLAQINRATWTGTENASRQTEVYNLAGIEKVLQWAPGSIDRILAGGDPTPRRDDQPEPPASLPPDFDLVAELDRITRLDIPARQQLELATRITEMYERAQAEHRAER